jgi:hypothetical protein
MGNSSCKSGVYTDSELGSDIMLNLSKKDERVVCKLSYVIQSTKAIVSIEGYLTEELQRKYSNMDTVIKNGKTFRAEFFDSIGANEAMTAAAKGHMLGGCSLKSYLP